MKRLPLLPLCFLAACSTESSTETDRIPAPIAASHEVDLNTLLGEWSDVQDSSRTVFNEHWERAKDGSMAGLGFVLSGLDTVFIEHLGILNIEGKLHYAATVGGQNNGQAVLFALEHGTDSLVFTNPAHDFPQRIVYAPIGSDAWKVSVSGTSKGKFVIDRYDFVRKGSRSMVE